MAPPVVNTAMASLATGAGARPFAACRPPMAAPSLPPRRRALVVRAQNKDEWDTNLQDKLGTNLKDKLRNNLPNKLGTNLQEKSGNFKDKSGADRFLNVFKFWGPAPERINGRLAMVGFVSALIVEVYRGDGLLSQASNGAGMAWFASTALLFTVASLVPLLSGESPEDRSDDRMGIWTADAEIWNGRAAMVGLVALAVTEYLKGTPLINV